MIEDWKREIAILIYIKQEIDNLGESKFLSYSLPKIAATEEQLEAVERHMNHSLDPKYRLFLKHANGWDNFYLTVALFGIDELLDNAKMLYACNVLDELDQEGVLEETGFLKGHLIPIAVTIEDRDLFVITHPDSSNPGMIIWFAGYEVERFKDFDEFFLSMVDYNRAIYQNLSQGEATQD